MEEEMKNDSNIYREVLNFFDTEEYSKMCFEASQNQIEAGLYKKRIINEKKINTLLFIANKFSISRARVGQLSKIKKSEREDIIQKMVNEKISLQEAYNIVCDRGENRKCIYFIKDMHSKRIKIGKTKAIGVRFNALQNANGGDLKLIAVIDGYAKEEQVLHKKFKKYRHHGEWFEPDQEVLDYIKKITDD